MQLVIARSGLKVPIGSAGEDLELLVLPTPRSVILVLSTLLVSNDYVIVPVVS